MTLVVVHATLDLVAHGVLVRAHGGIVCITLAIRVGKVSDELRNSELPQLNIPDEIVLHIRSSRTRHPGTLGHSLCGQAFFQYGYGHQP